MVPFGCCKIGSTLVLETLRLKSREQTLSSVCVCARKQTGKQNCTSARSPPRPNLNRFLSDPRGLIPSSSQAIAGSRSESSSFPWAGQRDAARSWTQFGGRLAERSNSDLCLPHSLVAGTSNLPSLLPKFAATSDCWFSTANLNLNFATRFGRFGLNLTVAVASFYPSRWSLFVGQTQITHSNRRKKYTCIWQLDLT